MEGGFGSLKCFKWVELIVCKRLSTVLIQFIFAIKSQTKKIAMRNEVM